jgi:hypothetical protein
MMVLPELADVLGAIVNVPAGTLLRQARPLRKAGLLTKGKRGGNEPAAMSSRDAVNLILVSLIDHRYATLFADDVQRVRDLPLDKLLEFPPGYAVPLRFASARTAGEALDAIVDDMRCVSWQKFCDGKKTRLTVTCDTAGRTLFISLIAEPEPGSNFTSTQVSFNHQARSACERGIERNVTIPGEVLSRLAAALGP